MNLVSGFVTICSRRRHLGSKPVTHSHKLIKSQHAEHLRKTLCSMLNFSMVLIPKHLTCRNSKNDANDTMHLYRLPD